MASDRRPLNRDGQQSFNPQLTNAHNQIASAGSAQQPQQESGKPADAPSPALTSLDSLYQGLVSLQTPLHGIASNPSIAPSSSSSLTEVSQQLAALECAPTLGSYFPIETVPRTAYTDQDLADIARLLQETGRTSWSRIPRIYTVLRLIDQLMAIDVFLEQGMNDMWFPFNVSQLPQSMSAFYRNCFIDHQNMVMTKAMNLESNGPRRHTHFKKGEEVPLTIGDTLGRGGFGAVYKAYSPLSGRTYALKTFRRTRKNAREVQSFMVELQVLRRINHHHCVELVASYTDSRNFGLLMSPVADCNLSSFYEVAKARENNQKALYTFFGCLANALRFLHDSKIRHRDIKPENILVKGTEVYLTDFGISLDWENLTRSTTTADSAKSWTYCAPEVADYQKRNSSSDVWSLGCVFLEMWTVLQGATAQDLRELMSAHSGRSRYYENLEIVLDWVARLSAHDFESREEVMTWVRRMLVIEPSARTTAEALFLSILNFEKRGKSKATDDRFCGDCCIQDHEEESEPESVSDDDVWAGNVGDNIATPATSPPATDPPLPFSVSSSTSHVLRQTALSVPFVSASLYSLTISETGSSIHNVDSKEDLTLLETSKNATSEIAESSLLRTASLDLAQDEVDTTSSSNLPRGPTAAKADQNADPATLTRVQTAAPAIEQETSLGNRPKIRQKAIETATSNNPTWPFTDLQGRLPAIIAEDWQSPSAFLTAVRSDVAFMQYLELLDSPQLKRLEAAAPKDLFPIMHLLLLNGLDVNNSNLKKPQNPMKGAMPLYQTTSNIWNAASRYKGISRLLIGFGAMVDNIETGNLSPLLIACIHGDIELVKIMLNIDQTIVNAQDDKGLTPIGYAANKGRHKIVDILIKRGADFRLESELGDTPGSMAATKGHLEVLKVLVENGMGADEGPLKRRPIHCAAEAGHTEVVKYLLSKGADPTRGSGKMSKFFPSSNAHGLAKKAGHEKLASILGQAVKEWKRSH